MDTHYRLDTYRFALPERLIAQRPLERRDESRLMVLDRGRETWVHSRFKELPRFLNSGDLLVVNDSRVIPARLRGRKESGGQLEVLLVREREAPDPESCRWECLMKPARRVHRGGRIHFGASLSARIVDRLGRGRFILDFPDKRRFHAFVESEGRVPLPPYIRREDDETDRVRYQTVFARCNGSVAAPTAGLHFSDRLLEELRGMGCSIASITLHVGLGTFLPVETEDVREHRLHTERLILSEQTCRMVQQTQERGGRVIAVGTTSARALEFAGRREHPFQPGCYECDTYIYPGYEFRVIRGLITNFHLPGSSLILLCAAFAGVEFLLRAYAEAIDREYRFYSYGDAMFVF